MSSNKTAYAASTSITITAGTLANATARQAASVDNGTNLYLDALVTVICGVGTVSGTTKAINVYAAGSEDGTTWPGEGSGNNDGVTGADAAITLESPTNLKLLGSIATPTSTKTYEQVFYLSNVFPVPPRKWTIVIENQTGAAFTSCSLSYSGAYSTSA